jgi:uncharacterized protein (DUF2147 family)
MKKYILIVGAILIFGFAGLAQAQSQGDITGTYFVPKGPSTVEIVRDGKGYRVTQVSSTSTKEQAHNGKVRATIPEATASPLAGTVNDLDSGKQYQATWEITDGGKTLTMKVKVAFMHVNYVWQKQSGTPLPSGK